MMKIKFSKKKILMFLLAVIFITGFFNFGQVLHTQAQTIQDATGLTQVASATGLGTQDIRVTIAKIIRIFLGFLGIVALVIMLYGGFVYMTAGGDDQKVSMAKKIMINGAIGLVIIFSSFAITQFVLNKLAGATSFGQVSLLPAACADHAYAAANPLVCNPGFNPCDNLDNQFVVKSITPSTPASSTGMNNFAVRVIFSQPIAAGTAAEDVFIISRGDPAVNVNSEFSFSFVDGNMAVVQANSPSVPNGVLDLGNYTITVLSNLTSTGGLVLGTSSVCGSFPNNGSFSVTTTGVVDSQAPSASAITYNGLTYGGAVALPRGRTYKIGSAITDNSGIGYVRLEVQRRDSVTNAAIGAPVVVYDGPRTSRGSQATASDPYNFSYNYLVSSNSPVFNSSTNSYFRVTLRATDIDHNQRTITSDFVIVEGSCAFGTGEGAAPGCRGNGSCVADLECLSGVCNETTGQCVNVPLISDVSPWSQAGGSWVTISGSAFGSNEGTVEFGIDNTNDGDPDVWVPANVASCGGNDVWQDNYVIVEVPQDDLVLPNFSSSSIRVNHEVYVADPITNIDFFDTTTNNRGPLPGPNVGWFTKDNSLSLPGLCAINPVQGLSGTNITVFGQKLGVGGAGSSLSFGGLAGVIRSWQADGTEIGSTVPDNMSPGFVGVVATVGGQQSNGLPFRVMSAAEVNAPIIESVTPSDITPDSYVTISGKRFGNNGTVYLSPNATTNCPDAACIILNTTLPAACGDTWNDEQIIAQVPTTAPVGQRIVIVQNEFGLQSIPGTADRLNIIAGAPLPSICALSPIRGIAPLKTGSLNITGINFSANPKLYFWGPRSVPTNTATWLSLTGAPVSVGGVQTITTRIPVDYGTFTSSTDPFISSLPLVGPFGGDGFSMQSGSIKLKSLAGAGPESNSVKYTVQDCREVSETLWPDQMICCSEGPSTGSFIHESKACPGTTRTGGYVWRFTTGRIAQLPRVLEACDTTTSTSAIISPTPWRYQGNGDSICLNAQISVDFNMPIEVASFGTNTNKKILLFSAGTGNEPATSSPQLADVNSLIANLPTNPPETVTSLTIKNSSSGNLAPDTWYRVVLLNGIQSLETVDIFNVPTPVRRPLLRSRPCKIDLDLDGNVEASEDITAYCFDFKTGPAGSECVLESARIKPSEHIVDTLGPVKKGSNDLIYEVWGRGNQACSIISVDTLGWVWGAFDMPAGIGNQSATVATLSGKTHLAKATALQEPAQTGNTNVSVQASVNYAGQTIVGDSDLFINLGPARVIDYWPNCGSACVNAVIGGKFNRMMDPSSYAGNVLLYQCPNENACILAANSGNFSNLTGLPIDLLPSHLNNRYEAQFAPRANLTPNTSYLVYFTDGIYSVGQVDSNNNIVPNRHGNSLEPKIWQFKTKVDSGVCIADKVVTAPDPFTAYIIGEKTRYTANPFTNPDQCNSKGQALNAWGFGWAWSSANTSVATTSLFATVGQLKPACNYGCLPKGADIEKGTYNLAANEPWLCGNGRVDLGEDCDIGVAGETAGTSCSLNCLRPGNSSIGTGAGQCGNSIVDSAQGEECDNEVGCSSNCVHMGSSSDPVEASGGQSGTTITEYRMWYSGNEGSYSRIYLATSTDGINWKKYNNSLPADSDTVSTNGRLAKGTVTSKGDQYGASGPSVIKDGNIYKMWYTGFDGLNSRIYYATSPNGFDWTKKNNVVEARSNTTGTDGRIPLGNVGSGDYKDVSSPSVLKDGSIYKMWYAGHDGASWRIYYATSPDGLTWTKYDNSVPPTVLDSGSGLTSTNGRLPLGTSGKGDDFGVFAPTVVKDGSVYKMWYSSAQDGDINWEITFAATSPDGLNWTKVNNNIPSPYSSDTTGTGGRIPLGTNLATRGDHHATLHQFVLKDGVNYKMWYTGMNNYVYRLFYATSADGLTWTKQDNTTSTISDTFSTNGRIALGSNGRGDDAGTSDVSVIKDIISTGASSVSSAQALCGSGEVTVGEDCEPGMNGDILNVTCASNCLHIGTRTATSWCELPANIASANSLECKTAVSVCGNDIIEKSEECEVINGSVVVFRSGTNFISNAPVSSCSSNCLLQNICNTDITLPANNVELACDSTVEGCNPDCTLHGSSVDEYVVSSLCGDGVNGVGEFSQCEYNATELAAFGIPGQNPIQAVTAVGEGTLDPATLSQSTEIVSRIVSIRTTTTPQLLAVAQQRADSSDYTLQCGFTESIANVSPFNDCPSSSDGLTQGVGYNSCCYPRPHRVLPMPATDTSKYYPLDGSGFSGGPAGVVCRNTAIYITFDGDIDEATLVNNFILAKGELAVNANCGSTDKDITNVMGATLAYNNQNNSLENNGGIWYNIFNSVKKLLAWFVEKAKASVINDTVVNVGTWCKTDLAGVPEVVKIKDINGKVVESIASAYLSDLLDENATYAILLRGGKTGIKDIRGVGINSPIAGVNNLNDSFVFRTGTDVCRIDNVTIPNPPAVYTSPQISQSVTALAQSADGRLISQINGVYDWSWSWGPINDPIFNIPNFVTPASVISSKNLEGQRIGYAHATIITDKSLEDNQLGQIITGDVELTAVFCEHPWPPVTPVTFYPYEDGVSVGSSPPNNDGTDSAGVFNGSAIPTVGGNYFNFKTSYCADAGRQSDMSDDLPYLRPFVFTGPFPDTNTLKKFLFFNDLNNDAIGIQVFKNTGRDSVRDWLRTKLGVTTGFKSVSIDGYDAMADDSNYYIDALNVVGANSYNNIYLISINKDAQDNTRKVFDEIISSLEFNINFTDNKYCSGNATMSCTADYECADENGIPLFGGNATCDAQKTKMRRDWKRVVTLVDIQEKLKNYRENNTKPSPKLATGTYLPGQTRSVWPSWGNLASQIGSVGVDPLNTWSSCSYCSNDTVAPLTLCSADEDCIVPGSTCIRVDSQTCWDDINNRFICPKMSNVFGYKLQDPPFDSDYTIYSPMEYFNSADMSSFLDTSNSHFVLGDALCVGGPGSIISPTSGTCGNNVINSGEVCDPPGQVIVTTQSCNIAPGTNNGFEVRTCSSACQLSTATTCQKISTCGNGRKEPTEQCDEGALNGTYGHCRADCQGFSGQYCGNSVVDKHCSFSSIITCNVDTDCISVSQPYATCVPLEVCDSGSAVNGLYGQGCAVDCQSRGARCGDGIIQTEETGTVGAHELCDDGNSVDVGDGCKNNCTPEAEVILSASTSIPTGCGDGIIQSGESCDSGTSATGSSFNGIACTPKYGEYCNYCSFDCGEVLYVEPTGYCGNQIIDTIETDFLGTNTYEDCEYLPRECHGTTCVEAKILHGTPPGTATLVDSCKTDYGWNLDAELWTTHTGGYKCTNSCTKYETACTACGNLLTTSGGARPRVSVINPMVGADVGSSTWFQNLFAKFYMKKVDGLHIATLAGEKDSSKRITYTSASGESPKKIYGSDTDPANKFRIHGIATNLACNGTYYMCFNQNGTTGECLDTTFPSQDLWPFSVKSEADYVDNTYIVSPNPPTGTVRMVLKWSEKDKLLLNNGKFGLGILNASSSTTYLARQNSKCSSIIIDSNNYWITGSAVFGNGSVAYPVGCERWPLGSPHTIVGNQGVFMHKAFNTSTTYIQSMTVSLYDAQTPINGSLIESGPFTVFVEAQSGLGIGVPMNTLLNTEAEVLIFEHHDPSAVGGSPNTVFPPDYSYKIKYAQKSSNSSARYWHVLNLKRNDDSTSSTVGTFYKYAIEPAQKIRTDTASLIAGTVSPNVVETSTGLVAFPVAITSTYTATVYQICGNGVVEGTETCDDGASNGNPGMCNTLCNGTVPFQILELPPQRIR